MPARKISFFLFLFFFIAAVSLSVRLSKGPSLFRKNPYALPSAQFVKIASGTFRPLAADLLFVKGVLDLSEEIPQKGSYLINLFEISAKLDPKMEEAYFLGGVVAPKNKEDISRGISFLKQGMELNPNSWKIPYWIGFNYLELGAHSRVIQYYKKAASYPDSPNYIKTNLPFFYYQAQKYQQGIIYLQTLLKIIEDKRVVKIIENKVRWLKNMIFLEKKISDYKREYGQWPKELDDLVKKGLLEKIPEDSFGRGYYLEEGPDKPQVKSRFQ